MTDNPFDSGDRALFDVATRVAGPIGALPFTAEMLRERPSGDLFGWSQNAGMGWEPSAMTGRRVPDALDARRDVARQTARRSRSAITPDIGKSAC